MPSGFKALKGRTYSDIEIEAREARTLLELAPGAAPCMQVLESLGDIVTHHAGGEVPVMWGVKDGIPSEGMTVFRPDIGPNGHIDLLLHEAVYQALRRDDPRARFTFAHELGHVLLHAADLVQRGQLEHFEAALRRGGLSHSPWQDTEFQANAFAAAFLMPARELRSMETSSRLTITRVMREFGVSREAAQHRITNYVTRRSELI